MSIALMGPGGGAGKIKELEKYKKTLLWSDKTNNKQGSINLTWENQTKEYQIYYVITKYYYNSDNENGVYGQYIFPGHWTMLVGKDTGEAGAYTTCRWVYVKPNLMHMSYSGAMYQWKIIDTSDGHDECCKVIEIYGVEGSEL